MAKTAEKSGSQVISPHIAVGVFFAGSIVLSVIAGLLPISLGRIISGPWGLFENLTVVFYLVAAAQSFRMAWTKRGKGEKAWSPWFILGALAFVLAGEEAGWLIPLFYDDYKSWPFTSLQGLIAQSYEGVPDGASLKVVAMIAGVRIGALLAIVYGILAAYYYRHELKGIAGNLKSPGVLYGASFAALLVIALLLQAGKIPGGAMFEECFEMLAAGALALACMKPWK